MVKKITKIFSILPFNQVLGFLKEIGIKKVEEIGNSLSFTIKGKGEFRGISIPMGIQEERVGIGSCMY